MYVVFNVVCNVVCTLDFVLLCKGIIKETEGWIER